MSDSIDKTPGQKWVEKAFWERDPSEAQKKIYAALCDGFWTVEFVKGMEPEDPPSMAHLAFASQISRTMDILNVGTTRETSVIDIANARMN